MNLTKRLRVEPGSQIDLAGIDPSFHGKWSSAEAAKAELDGNLGRIAALQRELYADRSHCLLRKSSASRMGSRTALFRHYRSDRPSDSARNSGKSASRISIGLRQFGSNVRST